MANPVEFRTELETYLTDLVKSLVEEGTDPDYYVKTFDDHLHDFDLMYTPDPWPFIVVAVRTTEISGSSEPEIGTRSNYNLNEWQAHIYYIDIVSDYAAGKIKRDHIMGKIAKEIKRDPRLGNFEVSDGTDREYVWNTRITNVLWDQGGQETEYSFTCEMYLSIETAES